MAEREVEPGFWRVLDEHVGVVKEVIEAVAGVVSVGVSLLKLVRWLRKNRHRLPSPLTALVIASGSVLAVFVWLVFTPVASTRSSGEQPPVADATAVEQGPPRGSDTPPRPATVSAPRPGPVALPVKKGEPTNPVAGVTISVALKVAPTAITVARAEAAAAQRAAERRELALTLEELEREVRAAAAASERREAILALAKELKAPEPEDRVKALLWLAAHGPDANIVGEDVIAAIRDRCPAVQQAAADALGAINPKVCPHVVAILRGPVPGRREAISELGNLGAEAGIAIPLLLDCNENTPSWGGGNAKAGRDHEDLFPVIARIAPKDKRFAAAVLASIAGRRSGSTATVIGPSVPSGALAGIAAANQRQERALRDRRLGGIGQLKVIDATAAEKVGALAAALDDRVALPSVVEALEDLGVEAKPALPVLKKLKSSTAADYRNAAIRAIARIELALEER